MILSCLRQAKQPKLIYPFASKKYILSQFPYPSGELHLGHARVYYIGDTLSRYYKLQGNDVIYPIGFDSFGLPAENAAIIHGKDPKVWTQNNIKQMKEQLNSLNIQFNWQRQFATHTPAYYKWTQQIFLQLFRKGLAYKAVSQVNWDPVDQTVLANEQVDNQGKSWRSGALVEKKQLSQWFLGITQYANELQSSLPSLQWIQRVKSMQAGWIGFQEGFKVGLKIVEMKQEWSSVDPTQCKSNLDVFVKNLYSFTNDCKIRLNIEDKNGKNKTSSEEELLGFVKNPFSDVPIPVVRGKQQNGIKYELFVVAQNSDLGKLAGILQGKPTTVMRIKDWSISRQRFWGTPIPIIYCLDCGIVPVPEEQLPVILPEWKNEGNPLLSDHFKNCNCPHCGKPAKRQTDTMDTFVDSSWYYLRFLNPKNQQSLCSKQLADKWLPVDIYIGGIEHAIMHLLYARFIMRTLSDIGISDVKQPFKQLIVQGLVKGKAFKVKKTGKYLKPEEVSQYNPIDIEETYEKMSKSKFNGLNPQTLVQKFGPDSLRIAIFFASPPEHDVDFSEQLLVSAQKFLNKIGEMKKSQRVKASYNSWRQVVQKIKQFSVSNSQQSIRIKKVLAKLEESMQKRFMHVYVANTMELFNEIKSMDNKAGWQQFVFNYIFMSVLSVIAPKTVSQLGKQSLLQNKISYEWPQSSFFGNQKEYIIMKDKKMVESGFIEYQNSSITEQEIREKLNLDEWCLVKNNKKSIVIVLK